MGPRTVSSHKGAEHPVEAPIQSGAWVYLKLSREGRGWSMLMCAWVTWVLICEESSIGVDTLGSTGANCAGGAISAPCQNDRHRLLRGHPSSVSPDPKDFIKS